MTVRIKPSRLLATLAVTAAITAAAAGHAVLPTPVSAHDDATTQAPLWLPIPPGNPDRAAWLAGYTEMARLLPPEHVPPVPPDDNAESWIAAYAAMSARLFAAHSAAPVAPSLPPRPQ